MKTSCWYTYQGPGRIGISRGAPRGGAGGYRIYRQLAPTRELWAQPGHDYTRKQFEDHVLRDLDPQHTWDVLHKMAAGHEPVLLCFERPPLTTSNWCHRRIVAEWFEEKLGVQVPEYGTEQTALNFGAG